MRRAVAMQHNEKTNSDDAKNDAQYSGSYQFSLLRLSTGAFVGTRWFCNVMKVIICCGSGQLIDQFVYLCVPLPWSLHEPAISPAYSAGLDQPDVAV
ncbi:MAG: hypothetical protein RL180_1207 [Pseudomonadota bacterium]